MSRRIPISVALAGAAAVAIGPAGLADAAPSVRPAGVAAQLANPLRLTALGWSTASIDATTGTATADLTWTVKDAAASAHNVTGALVIGVPGSKPGTFASLSFDVSFALHGRAQVHGTGTPSQSTYRYTFAVPQYAQVSSAKWQVTAFNVRDDAQHQLTVPPAQLASFNATLTASELVDTHAPTFANLALVPNGGAVARPYVYATRYHAGTARYSFDTHDDVSGLYSAAMRLTGPHARTISVDIPVNRMSGSYQCGFMPGTDLNNMSCGVTVSFPAGTPTGRWAITFLQITDDAGNTTTAGRLNVLPVTVTANQVLRASGFNANPNPINNWSALHPYTVRFSTNVSGARGGIAAVYVDTVTNNGATCAQTKTRPTVKVRTATVPIQVDWMLQVCQVTGIAVVDGRGDVSLYGTDYGAPDPYFLIRQVPDVSAPRATGASINPASVTSSQTKGFTQITLTINLKAGYAPTDGISITLYDSRGNNLGGIIGGAFDNNGVVTQTFTLPGPLKPGKYPVGFSVSNAAQETTVYDPFAPNGQPLPGAPLVLTVTSG